jgi:hypothetical protein
MNAIMKKGRSTGIAGDVSITLAGPGPGCAGAYSDGLEETTCQKVKVDGDLACTGAKVGRYCPAVGSVVTEVSHVKATFAATSTKVTTDNGKPLRKGDTATGGMCACTLTASPFTPFSAVFTGTIDNAGQTKVKGN